MELGTIRTWLGWRRIWNRPISALSFFVKLAQDPASSNTRGTYRAGNVKCTARPKDWWAVEEMLYQCEYDFILPLLATRQPPMVLDVGANIGMFAIAAIRLNSSCKVLSVEPSQDTYELLEGNCKLNNSAHWRTHRAALWKEDGQIAFENRAYSTSSRIAAGPSISTEYEQVPCLSLASLLKMVECKEIDLLKLDIEGAEEAALTGQETLLRKVAALIVEVHPPASSLESIVAILRGVYRHVYTVLGRKSSKPLLLGSNQAMDLPEFRDVGGALESNAA